MTKWCVNQINQPAINGRQEIDVKPVIITNLQDSMYFNGRASRVIGPVVYIISAPWCRMYQTMVLYFCLLVKIKKQHIV